MYGNIYDLLLVNIKNDNICIIFYFKIFKILFTILCFWVYKIMKKTYFKIIMMFKNNFWCLQKQDYIQELNSKKNGFLFLFLNMLG